MSTPIETHQSQIRCLSSTPLSLATGALNSVSSPPVDSIVLSCVANAAAANILTITNASFGQATTLTLPDPGVASSSLLLADNASGQTINTGNLTVTAGSIITTNGGVIQSGSSGNAGSLKVFPATASKGDLKITCSNQTGNTEVVLNAAAMGQATTLTVPDPGASTANVTLAPSIVTNNYPMLTSTQGVLADSNTGTIFLALSQSQVQGMFATPVQIVPSPGAGKTLAVLSATMFNNFNTSAFANGGVVVLQYGNTANGAGTNALSGTVAATIVTAAASRILPGLLPSTTQLTGVSAAGLFLSNQTGAFTGGNAASTIGILVEYAILTVTT